MAIFKGKATTNAGKNVAKRESLFTVDGNVN
jgi:hypothetical protein